MRELLWGDLPWCTLLLEMADRPHAVAQGGSSPEDDDDDLPTLDI